MNPIAAARLREDAMLRVGNASVVAFAALFVALGGTATAVTNYVISSNSQLGPGTVSGSVPTTGNHDNVIGGTIGGADVHDNSLTGADINESKLGKVPNAGKLAGHPPAYYGHVLPLSYVGQLDATYHTVLAIDGLSMDANCDGDNGSIAYLRFTSSVPSTINLFQIGDGYGAIDNGGALGSPSTYVYVNDAGGTTNNRVEGQAIYRRNSDGAVVTIAFHVFSTTCEVFGTALTTG
jgi:hypothetical protein